MSRMREPVASLRPPADEDAGRLADLLVACDVADIGHPDSDEEDVRWRWRMPRFDRERDAWIAESAGTVSGYGVVLGGTIEIRVHPDHRGRGIGTLLRKTAEQRATELPAPGDDKVHQNILGHDDAARELLIARGYEFSHHYARMERALDDGPWTVNLPDGIELHDLENKRDARRVYDAFVEAWAAYRSPDRPIETWEEWQVEYLEGEDYDPTQWLIADNGTDVESFLIALRYPDIGWIQLLATPPKYRGRGLGRALLHASFQMFKDRGFERAGLSVSSRNVPQARDLYERTGFTEVFRWDNYMKPIASISTD